MNVFHIIPHVLPHMRNKDFYSDLWAALGALCSPLYGARPMPINLTQGSQLMSGDEERAVI
jgi:hypothetical protein